MTELEDGIDDGPVDDTELEPSLTGVTADCVGWGDCTDLEDDVEKEPSLGSIEKVDQSRWAQSSRSDSELDHAESGIADLDGLLEQMGSQDWQQGAMA